MLYTFGLHELTLVGWIVALVYAMACALRLARFNVMIDDPEPAGVAEELLRRHSGARGRAHGAAAGLSASWTGVARPPGFAAMEAVYVLFIALMMVSRIPTYAGKTLGTRVPSANGSCPC